MKLLLVIVIAHFGRPSFGNTISEWSCDFDDGPCELREPEGTRNWISVDATVTRESNALDGPLRGVSNSGSFYQLYNATGQLVSPTVALHGDYCFSLDYYIIGSVYDSQINIAARQSESRFGQFHIFNREPSDNNLDGWQQYENTVTFDSSTNQLVIEAKTKTLKSLAIDNLRLSKGACPGRDVRECDFSGIVGGAVRNQVHYTLPQSCDWLTGSFLNHNHASWLITTNHWRTKSVFTSNILLLTQQFPELELKPLGPEDGTHCLLFSFRSSGEAWSITESAVNTNVTNVLFYNDVERYDRTIYHNSVHEIDPVVPIVVKLNIGENPAFYIESIKLVKGKCNKPATCDFSTSTCGYKAKDNYNNPMFVGQGRLMRPDYDYVPIANGGRNFMYVDYSSSMWTQSFTLNSENVVASGPHCVKVVFAQDWTREFVLLIRWDRTPQGSDSSVIVLRARFSNETFPWTTAIADFKAIAMFTVELQIMHVHGGRVASVKEISLTPGTCENKQAPRFGNVDFHCYSTGHYIPKYRACDGVIDCPMGEDEESCEERNHHCWNGGIPCKRRGHYFCLKEKTQFCDGIQDCDDAIDEDPRMCNESSFCDNYCLNNSECSFEDFICDCNGKNSLKRCSL